jgi:hypothetical protein
MIAHLRSRQFIALPLLIAPARGPHGGIGPRSTVISNKPPRPANALSFAAQRS